MREIAADDLRARLDRGGDLKLVAVMSEWGFEAKHIPGSLRVSNFDEGKQMLAADDEIIVYCPDPECAASRMALHVLASEGFTDLTHFPGGLHEWEDAGLPLEGRMVD